MNDADPSGRRPSPNATSLFVEYVDRIEAGEAVDIEELCRAHPALAQELRELHRGWHGVLEVLRSRDGATPVSERLRRIHGAKVDPSISLARDDTPQDAPSSGLVERLREHAPRGSRYKLLGEIARGGMGAILRVWDEDLRRNLAMKVVLGREDQASSSDTAPVDPKTLGRFLEEAQVTGQLDHPGIVPVHDLGLDRRGHVYFTMKLVRGDDLRAVYKKVKDRADGWSQTRALGVILKVCEAMSYAHAKGVVHRDLKPTNVMVGRYGEVYVMDWGLARVQGRPDRHDVRIRPAATVSVVRTEREEVREGTPDSPLVTMDGDVVGTPSYMPPEQAKGQLDRLGPWSDVYSIGAMIYQLLTGDMPFVPSDARVTQQMVLFRVLEGPPKPVVEIAPSTPAELVAICEKAMAREPGDRYPDTAALGDDLRAYLEGRVVRAYETGAWAEARKWVLRNKLVATASAIALLAVLAGGIAFAVKAEQEARAAALARESERRADEKAAEAEAEKDNVVSLLSAIGVEELASQAERLWPPHPAMIAEYERWLAEVDALVEGRGSDPLLGKRGRSSLAVCEAKLAEIRGRALSGPRAAGQGADRPDSATAGSASETDSWVFRDEFDRWWHQSLVGLIERLRSLNDPELGLASTALAPRYGWGVRRRLEFARRIEERSTSGADAAARWRAAVEAIAASPRYGGLGIRPQLGLLPIGPDPSSGLWEFAHLQSGEPASRDHAGKLRPTAESGLVLVLIPGGTGWIGAQSADERGHNHDPLAKPSESPPHEVTLDPFFLSKFELTQAQWLALTGESPSYWKGLEQSPIQPVDTVSWDDCAKWLPRAGLEFPTEAQWEYACRAGTDTPWWTGATRDSMLGAVNLADQSAARAGALWPAVEDWPELDDGWAGPAPVGTFRANDFGLHEMHGNVWEWCADGFDQFAYSSPITSRDGRRDVQPTSQGPEMRVYRGGAFNSTAEFARSAMRGRATQVNRAGELGIRPARRLDP